MAEVEVVEALLFGDHEAKIAAAEAVIHLTNKQRHKLADNGAIPPIVSMLHAPPDFKSLESAIFALMSLAYGSERFSLMAASGAIRVLNESLLENNTTQAKLDIVVTLHNLSTCHQLIPTIVSSSTVSSLIQLINESEKSSKLVEKSMGLLDHIVSSSEIGLKESAIGIRALVEAVEDGSKTCKEYAVGILLLICESSRERYRGMILREGAIPGLLQLSIDGTHRAKRSAKSLLRLLRDCKKVCRSEMSKNVVLEEVMGEIDRDALVIPQKTAR
ncbi:Armadillo [Cynara cardunculus var. scolymus]|uniref:Armadillo n=1 Tax=Cynara cardunculus var. scolymus TaxID=59895 RepID=A0A103XLC4_CYNCS|nr:Armadillo [Cynara cardunculus var. scolymus]